MGDAINKVRCEWQGPDGKLRNGVAESSLLTSLQALEHIVYYVVLAPHNNEQSDMLHHLFVDPALTRLELH